MFKLTKYLKPFIGLIVAAIVLLFVQAMADLALPDYMSNIVNKGIQQSGIDNAVPKAVRQSEMNKLTLFMNDEEKNDVLNNYTLVDKSNESYDKYVKEYPTVEKEPIFVLKEVKDTEIDKINPIMGKPFLLFQELKK